ncbi:MAG: phenylalanine--tRNA ligase subunit beta, partial [Chloroflexota bacterium]
VLNVLKIVTLSLIDRGGKAYASRVHYPEAEDVAVTPDLGAWHVDLNAGYVNAVTGLKLTARQIAGLLPKAGHGVEKVVGDVVSVLVPCYRVDVMHAVDLVEDVAIAYGYDKIRPLWRKLPTMGGLKPDQHLLDVARDLMVGLGFQEVYTYTLTSPDCLFAKMNLKKQRTLELGNPKVQTMTCMRSWLLPSMLEFLSNNLSVEYPQKIFELGKVTELNEKSETKTRDVDQLAAAVSHANASFTEMKSCLDAFFMNLGLQWQIKETRHPSFIDGRAGLVIVKQTEVGLLGEISPLVLESWGLENPVAAFELDMSEVVRLKCV